ncbi:MAG: pilus assembly FimT family protein [Candidatus Saccharimonadales bacterium]
MKKLNKNESGFGAVEIILVLVIVAILGFVGWYVLNSKNKTNNNYNNASNSSTTATNVKPTYTLPADWTEMTCNGGGLKANLAYPNNDKAVSCDDRTNVMLIDFGAYPAANFKCMTASEVSQYNKTKPLSDYTCKEITIRGVKATNTIANYGGGLQANYDFNHTPQLHITYYSNANGKLTELSTLTIVAQSVKF